MAARKDLTLEEKLQIINSTSPKKIIAEKFKVNIVTIYRIIKNKEKIIQEVLQNKPLAKKDSELETIQKLR